MLHSSRRDPKSILPEIPGLLLRPWLLAILLYRPSDPTSDDSNPAVAKLTAIRSYVGFIGTVILSLPYLGILKVWGPILDGSLESLNIYSLAVTAGVGLWRIATLKKISVKSVPLLPAPLLRAVGFIVTTEAAIWLSQLTNRYFFLGYPGPSLIIGALTAVSALWVATFIVVSVLIALYTSFGSDEAHPMLGAICTLVTVCSFYIVNLLGFGASSASYPHQSVGDMCALLSSSSLCITELIWLYRHGARLDRVQEGEADRDVGSQDRHEHQGKGIVWRIFKGDGVEVVPGLTGITPVGQAKLTQLVHIRMGIISTVMLIAAMSFILTLSGASLQQLRAPKSSSILNHTPVVIANVLPGNAEAIWNLPSDPVQQWRQQIQIITKADDTFWGLNWTWNYSAGGAYFGLVTNNTNSENASAKDQVFLSAPGGSLAYVGKGCRSTSAGVKCYYPISLHIHEKYKLALVYQGQGHNGGPFWWDFIIGDVNTRKIVMVAKVAFPGAGALASISDYVSYLPSESSNSLGCSQIPKSLTVFGPLEYATLSGGNYFSVNDATLEGFGQSACPGEWPHATPSSLTFQLGQ